MPIITKLWQFKAKDFQARRRIIEILTSVVFGLLCLFVAFRSSWNNENYKGLSAESAHPHDKSPSGIKQDARDQRAKAQPVTSETQLTVSTSAKASSGGVGLGNTAYIVQLSVHNREAMNPQFKGLQVLQKQIASPDSNYPYAVEMTFPVQSVISPFAIAVTTDNPTIMRYTMGHYFRGIIQSRSMGPSSSPQQPWQPQTYHYIEITSPSVTPTRPLIVTMMCSTSFHVLAVSKP